ncbi:hypothetical protein OfM1_08890 [Lactovum odontotermitis]
MTRSACERFAAADELAVFELELVVLELELELEVDDDVLAEDLTAEEALVELELLLSALVLSFLQPARTSNGKVKTSPAISRRDFFRVLLERCFVFILFFLFLSLN